MTLPLYPHMAHADVDLVSDALVSAVRASREAATRVDLGWFRRDNDGGEGAGPRSGESHGDCGKSQRVEHSHARSLARRAFWPLAVPLSLDALGAVDAACGVPGGRRLLGTDGADRDAVRPGRPCLRNRERRARQGLRQLSRTPRPRCTPISGRTCTATTTVVCSVSPSIRAFPPSRTSTSRTRTTLRSGASLRAGVARERARIRVRRRRGRRSTAASSVDASPSSLRARRRALRTTTRSSPTPRAPTGAWARRAAPRQRTPRATTAPAPT